VVGAAARGRRAGADARPRGGAGRLCPARALPRRGPGVEIQELYIRPDCQGLGFGTRLFAASRAALAERGPVALTIWCLGRNRHRCAFYRARGGRETARTGVRFGGVDLEQIRFSWP
jgi:GNAT superfamily N-acetyltransferase